MRKGCSILPHGAAALTRQRPRRMALGYRFIKVDGRWCYLYRAIDGGGALVAVMLSEPRDIAAVQRNVRQAPGTVGQRLAKVTTDGHVAYPRALSEALGEDVLHRTRRYLTNPMEQDHRLVKQRSSPMRSFTTIRSAARFARASQEQRPYFRRNPGGSDLPVPVRRVAPGKLTPLRAAGLRSRPLRAR